MNPGIVADEHCPMCADSGPHLVLALDGEDAVAECGRCVQPFTARLADLAVVSGGRA